MRRAIARSAGLEPGRDDLIRVVRARGVARHGGQELLACQLIWNPAYAAEQVVSLHDVQIDPAANARNVREPVDLPDDP